MRDPVRRAVPRLVPPSQAARRAAKLRAGSRSAHEALMSKWPCLAAVEVVQPEAACRPGTVTVAAWNLERCKHVEASAALIRAAGADVVLATEMDVGLARSGQRNTVRELARMLGMGWVFGVEFVELTLGGPRERSATGGGENAAGLHGNAVLSRLPLRDAALLPLDAGGDWFVRQPKRDGQVRVGGRMAVSAVVESGFGPVTVASAHFESESNAAARAVQAARLLGGLDRVYGAAGRAVVGGDLNTHAFHDRGVSGAAMLARPAECEPAFGVFSSACFDWRGANSGRPTTRRHPYDPPDRPATCIDWLLTRGVTATAPAVVPAVAPDGTVLSDHDLILVRIGP